MPKPKGANPKDIPASSIPNNIRSRQKRSPLSGMDAGQSVFDRIKA
jgi:hypothetical protein